MNRAVSKRTRHMCLMKRTKAWDTSSSFYLTSCSSCCSSLTCIWIGGMIRSGKGCPQRQALLQVFKRLLDSAVSRLRVNWLHLSARKVVELDMAENAQPAEQQTRSPALSIKIRTLVRSRMQWAEPGRVPYKL